MLKCMLSAAALAIAASAAQAQSFERPFGDLDVRNSTNSPQIYSPSGEYLGNLNRNQFDPNSVSNQFGAGSQFRHNGVNNQFSPNYMPGLAPRRGF